MTKEFSNWNTEKIKIHENSARPNFKTREIWFAKNGVNIGNEQDGKGKDFLRPVIIFRKFNKSIFWSLPLTSSMRDSLFYYHFSFGNNRKSSVILSQIRLMDAKRLVYKIGVVSLVDFEQLKEKLKALLP